MCTLIKHTICESLVKMQYFRHEWSSKMYENTQKIHIKIKGCSITCSHIWYYDTLKSVYRLNTHFLKVSWSYMLPNTNAVHFCDIGQCFHPAAKNSVGNQKSFINFQNYRQTFLRFVWNVIIAEIANNFFMIFCFRQRAVLPDDKRRSAKNQEICQFLW